jgi:CRISPR/Cas system-associated exonuclease Cas4 (RecB family)
MGEDKHISHTQISMYLKCGQQYYFRYCEGKKVPPAVAMLKGRGIHEGAHQNYKQKIESHEDLKKKDIIDISVNAFEQEVKKEGFQLSKHEIGIGAAGILGKAKDRIVVMADLFSEEVAPTIQPTMTEQSIILNILDLPPIKTILDVVDNKKNIRDLKTTGKKKTQDEIDKSLQLTMYTVAYNVLQGEPPSYIIYDILVDKNIPEYQVLGTKRDHRDFQVGYNIMKSAVQGIKKEVFMPAPEGVWWCSERFCGYWNICPFIKKI